MTREITDLDHLKRGVSVLATCIVQTINETDPTYQDRFLKKLTEAYYEIRDNSDQDEIQTMELISWTRSLITGFDFSTGQGKPFLDK